MSNNTGTNKKYSKRWEGGTNDLGVMLPTYPPIRMSLEEYKDPKKKRKAIRREKGKNALKLQKEEWVQDLTRQVNKSRKSKK
jgi:hypothetical protein